VNKTIFLYYENNNNSLLPDCQSAKIKKNGKKSSKKQNFIGKECGRQFIGDHALAYKGCHSVLTQKILLMPVRGIRIINISVIEQVNFKKALTVLVCPNHKIKPK
jgi:transposase-like protein